MGVSVRFRDGGAAGACRVLALAAVLTGLWCVLPSALAAAGSVQVAIVGPMSGTSSAVGMQYRVGVSAALKSLPGGLLLGREVKIGLHDDSCNPTIAESVAHEIASQPPAVVIGHSCSGATVAGAPIYAGKEILQISPASSSPKVTELGIPTIFRMIGRDDLQGRLAAERIAARHAGKKAGVLFFPNAYSSGLAKTAIEAMRSLDVVPVAEIQATASAASYAAEIMELKSRGVEVLYLVGGGLDCGIFLRQARQMGAGFAVIGSDTMVLDVFVKAAEGAADGVPFTFPPEAARLPSAAAAVDAIRGMGQEPAGYTLLAYAAAQVWIEGVERAQSFEAGKVAGAIRGKPVRTILGEVSFDGRGDIVTPYQAFGWYAWKDGERAPID
ncbi:MAG: branched-chain amino acid ABC transporter substrate-binding protein [Thermodesulfobacteriota bacterium]